jgi:hypothetical protein
LGIILKTEKDLDEFLNKWGEKVLWFSWWIKIWIYGFYDSKVHTLIRCFKFLIVWTKQKVMLLYFNLLNSISQFKFNK